MERERITISIKKKVLQEIDSIIDGANIRNRSHAIENIAARALSLGPTNDVLILIGGKDAMKTLPAVGENLLYLQRNGFNKVHIALGSVADKAKKELGEGKDFGLKIDYHTEGEGSGGAVLEFKKLFKKTFVVINSNYTMTQNLDKLIEFHKQHKAVATVSTADLSEMKGLYIFEPEIFDYIPKGFSMIELDVFSKLNAMGKLIVRPLV